MGVVPEEQSVSSKAWRGGPAGEAPMTHHIQSVWKIMPFQGSGRKEARWPNWHWMVKALDFCWRLQGASKRPKAEVTSSSWYFRKPDKSQCREQLGECQTAGRVSLKRQSPPSSVLKSMQSKLKHWWKGKSEQEVGVRFERKQGSRINGI